MIIYFGGKDEKTDNVKQVTLHTSKQFLLFTFFFWRMPSKKKSHICILRNVQNLFFTFSLRLTMIDTKKPPSYIDDDNVCLCHRKKTKEKKVINHLVL